MIDYKDYIKEGIGENKVLEYWIEQPLFVPSDFKEAIERNYTSRLNLVTKNKLSIETEIEFIKEELIALEEFIKPMPSYDYAKLSFTERISGDCWFSDETINEFKRYFKEYYNYKIKEFQADYLKNKLKDLLEPKTTKTSFPDFFKSRAIYDKFIEYTQKHILDTYIDYSYLKKRMLAEKLIHDIEDNEFMRLIHEKMQLISKKDYESYLIEKGLRSLGKSSNTQRENNFNNVFEGLF